MTKNTEFNIITKGEKEVVFETYGVVGQKHDRLAHVTGSLRLVFVVAGDTPDGT